MIKNISTTFNYLKKDKMILFLSLVPLLIGIILYWFFAKWIYGGVLDWLNLKINIAIHLDTYNFFFKYVLEAFITILLFFIINWTFVLVVSILASPFNDIISEKVEKKYSNQNISVSNLINKRRTRILSIIFTEIKKMIIILILNFLALLFSWIPFLIPISIFLSSILLSVNFLDYTWSRHNLNYKECIKSYNKSFIQNSLMGLFLFILITIPIINLLIIPFSVIFYTLVYSEKNNEFN